MMTPIPWNEATAAVQAAQRILLVTHVSPDGDAIGSLLGLTNALRTMGKIVDAAVDGGVPDFLGFLPGSDTVLSKLDGGAWDVLISLDASDEARTGAVGAVGRANSAKVINLDHHATNTMFGDVHLVLPEAVSAAEVVYLWLEAMPFSLSRDVAVPLLTGLVTDTLGFRTSNVKAQTLSIAQVLMQAGASLTEITARTLDNKSFETVILWRHALTTVTFENQVIAAVVSQETLKQVNLREPTDAGLAGFLVKVDEAMVAVVFKELEDSRVEISLRSKPGYDVAQVAFAVGGGGHRQAAGATIPGPLPDAISRIMPMLYQVTAEGHLIIA